MPIQTNLSVSPYFDDYNENKDFYKVLFRPGVSVQTRELNQLQSILQKQIERFGDNIFKAGTIINGCSIVYHSVFPYVKIKDSQIDGADVNVNQFSNYYVKNQANLTPLVAKIATSVTGFESQAPNLKTLYLKYMNTGFANDGGSAVAQSSFAPNQILTVYDPRNIVESITSYNDSSGFANSDSVVILSAIAIQNSSGGTTFANSFNVGDYVGSGSANAQIEEIDTTSNSQVVILRVKPKPADLISGNADLWTFTSNTTLQSSAVPPSSVANVVSIVGSGAAASLKTGAQGEVDSITVTSKGSGYYALPTVSISSATANTQEIANANLVPQTYLTQVTAANSTSNTIGSGYAITVTPGVVYQKGYFSRVGEQLVIVEKYSNTPNAKAVGFYTTEEVINSNQDVSLLDNATGEPNYVAPGANRLKLTPSLVVMSSNDAEANTEFFSIVEFSEGSPYKQKRQTFYNVIGDELARRTSEESGNYVIDRFNMATLAATSFADEATSFLIQIDPGKAYLNGYRVETSGYYTANVTKGTETEIAASAQVSLNYGNYIRVNQLGGVFKFNIGDLVSLYPNYATYVTSTPGQTPSAGSLGTSLGTARIRSLVLESGVPGSPEAIYRLYLFDIKVATTQNFSLVKSVFYNGTTHKGVADAIHENGVAVLKDSNLSALVYGAGINAIKNSNNLSYIYRTSNETDFSIAANGILTFTATGSETFPYTNSAALSTDQEKELHIMPIADVRAAANLSGSLSCNTTSTQVNGTSTAFATELVAGDFIRIANSTANVVVQVNNIVNSTALFVKSNPATAFTGANLHLYFPKYVPISFERTTRTANVNAGANTLTIDLGLTLNAVANVAIAYNLRTSNTQPVTKTVSRNKFIRVNTSNNAATNTGPWALGVTDVIRLSKVYRGPNATFTDSDTTNVTDVTNDYYIDHNQNENFYGISYLYKKPNSNSTLANTQFLLVKFDYLTHGNEGLKTLQSYSINDTANLASSSSTMNTIEIPEVFTDKGLYYDLRDSFDIRPTSANTVVPNASAASAPINPTEPSESARFTSTEKKFPAPDSNLTGAIEFYKGRIDRVVIDPNGRFNIMKGSAGSPIAPPAPKNALTIQTIYVPPYPTLPQQPSARTTEFIDNSIANQKYTKRRFNSYRVFSVTRPDEAISQQPRGYTMIDIGSLDRRIAALEFYQTHTLVELLAQKKVIPSSSDAAIDRFKFGFFVDGFDNYRFADQNNPAYRAAIVDGYLTADVKEVNLPVVPTSGNGSPTGTLPMREEIVISQLKATDGPVIPVPNTAVNTAITRVTSFSWSPTTATINSASADVATFQYIVQPASVDPNSYYVEITVGAGLTGTITGNTVAVTSAVGADVQRTSTISGRLIQNIPGQNPNILNRSVSVTQNRAVITGNVVTGNVTTNTATNNTTTNTTPNTFNGSISASVDSNINQTVTYTYEYVGEVVENTVTEMYEHTIASWGNLGGQVIMRPRTTTTYTVVGRQQLASASYYITGEQSVDITVAGLKPSTPHTLLFNGVDQTSKVKSSAGVLGGGITTDSNGSASVRLYYNVDLSGTSDLRQAALNSLLASGSHSVTIRSSDGLSRASTTISVPAYVQQEINNYGLIPTAPPPVVTYGGGGDVITGEAGQYRGGGYFAEEGINEFSTRLIGAGSGAGAAGGGNGEGPNYNVRAH